MSRTSISTTGWTSLGTTTTDTLMSVEGGAVRIYIGTTTGIAAEQGALFSAGEKVVVPSGLAVSAYALSDGAIVVDNTFGA